MDRDQEPPAEEETGEDAEYLAGEEELETPRERGFLTEADREYLAGEREYASPQGRYKRRESVRERTRGAIQDFTLLVEHLDGEERRAIFDVDDPKKAAVLEGGLINLMGFIYRALEGDIDRQGELQHRPLSARFSHVLEKGVYQGEMARRRAADEDGAVRGYPSVEFDVSFRTPEFARWGEAAEALAEDYGRELGNEELRDLLVTAAMNTATTAVADDEDVREQVAGHGLEDLAERVAEAAREGDVEGVRYAVLDDDTVDPDEEDVAAYLDGEE